MTHLHLDCVGGLAGDMFIAALLDCDAESATALEQVIVDAGFSNLVDLELREHDDGTLSGKSFKVKLQQAENDHVPSHPHRHYKEIRSIIEQSSLDPSVKHIALDIFAIIATAEAEIHNKAVDQVAFHEVGAWDSIADILCASYLIHHLKITSSSCSALPLGSGQVKTAHGMLPVPAPATALILRGFEFFDDGIAGERITPTGAAILSYLKPGKRPSATLTHQGFGFGTKQFPGISNTVRALLLARSDHPEQTSPWSTDTIHQLEFEIDDQTPEQLASVLDDFRRESVILDVVQYSVYGKKNRLGHGIRLLAKGNIDETIELCFRKTSTLGIRHSQVNRFILNRLETNVSHEGQQFGVKIAHRPGGETAKVEMDDLQQSQGTDSLSELKKLRLAIESSALESPERSAK